MNIKICCFTYFVLSSLFVNGKITHPQKICENIVTKTDLNHFLGHLIKTNSQNNYENLNFKNIQLTTLPNKLLQFKNLKTLKFDYSQGPTNISFDLLVKLSSIEDFRFIFDSLIITDLTDQKLDSLLEPHSDLARRTFLYELLLKRLSPSYYLTYRNKEKLKIRTRFLKMANFFENRNELQQALWYYRILENQQDSESRILNIINEIFNIENISSSCQFLKCYEYHSTEPWLVKIKGGPINGILKKKIKDLSFLPNDIKSEKAAFILGEHLGLVSIPYTFLVSDHQETVASIQYFIDNTEKKNFRSFKDFVNRFAYGKLVIKNELNLFDYLTENSDRHLDNYLFYDQNIFEHPIGIDHSGLWGKGINEHLNEKRYSEMIPRKSVYLKLKNLDVNALRKDLKGTVLSKNVDAFLIRRNKFIDYIEEKRNQYTDDRVWPSIIENLL